MSILVGAETRLLVQGITGREGGFHAQQMQDYGTNVVAGMTPGKGGQTALTKPVPVFDTCREAVVQAGANTTVIYVPASGAPDAILDGHAPSMRFDRDRVYLYCPECHLESPGWDLDSPAPHLSNPGAPDRFERYAQLAASAALQSRIETGEFILF